MRLFFSYLKGNLKTIGAFLLFNIISVVIFGLYHLPVLAVGYSMAVCTFLGMVFLMIDFAFYDRRHKKLEQLKYKIVTALEGLPAPNDKLEQDYQEILRILYADKMRLDSETSRRFTDMAEYYTTWAHQIKTPIAAMRLILQGQGENQNRELGEELKRIEQYVEMVMCYLRLDSDDSDYRIRQYDLDAIVRQAVRKNASQFIYKKIKLEYEPIECKVLTDEKWLLFVMEQIISNALKYTRAGVITITLEADKTLCIRDTGIGIAPEDIQRVFDKGYTGFNGRRDKQASGIGLYLCRRICQNLGHKIWISSVLDEGTHVYISLKSAPLQTE